MAPRSFTSADYPVVCQWWTARQWPQIPLMMLPRRGFIVDGYCAGFLYLTDSPIAWLEWVVSNPDSDKIERQKALDNLISSLLNAAKEAGCKAVFSAANHPGLIERYKSHGFQVSDTGMTHVLRTF